MIDRLLSLLAFAVLLAFLGILWGFVPRINLGIVLLLALTLAAYDFIRPMLRRRRDEDADRSE